MMVLRSVVLSATLAQLAAAQLPTGPPVWQMNLSTIIMP
jgi:hypothetical protein